MAILLQFAVGLVFGLGLLLSGMSDPAKVLNFLDLGSIASGGWDPSLAFVMAGAVAVTFVGFRLVLRQPRPLFAERFHLPTSRELDLRIIAGPALFGVGWGACGLLPGAGLDRARLRFARGGHFRRGDAGRHVAGALSEPSALAVGHRHADRSP